MCGLNMYMINMLFFLRCVGKLFFSGMLDCVYLFLYLMIVFILILVYFEEIYIF